MSKAGILKAGRPSSAKSKAATLASLADKPKMKQVNFELEEEIHSKLKMLAASKGKSISVFLREYIERSVKTM